MRLIGESRKKDDRLDAQTLARLTRIDPKLLYPVKHRGAQAQADLTLIRARARTSLVNTARGLAKSYGERLRGCNVRNLNPEKAEGMSLELQRALEPLLAGEPAIEPYPKTPDLQTTKDRHSKSALEYQTDEKSCSGPLLERSSTLECRAVSHQCGVPLGRRSSAAFEETAFYPRPEQRPQP